MCVCMHARVLSQKVGPRHMYFTYCSDVNLRATYADLRELTPVHVSSSNIYLLLTRSLRRLTRTYTCACFIIEYIHVAYAELKPTYADLRPCMFLHQQNAFRLRGAYMYMHIFMHTRMHIPAGSRRTRQASAPSPAARRGLASRADCAPRSARRARATPAARRA